MRDNKLLLRSRWIYQECIIAKLDQLTLEVVGELFTTGIRSSTKRLSEWIRTSK